MPGNYPVPAIRLPAEDLEDVQTSWGLLPRWKARALALSEIQSVIRESVRNDSAEHPLHDNQKPPRLAADDASALFADTMARVRRLRETQDMIRQCDALEARLDNLARGEKARAALFAAEREFTSPEEDDPEATRH